MLMKELARHEWLRIDSTVEVEADESMRDRFSREDEVRVFDKQVVCVLEVRSEGRGEEARPEFALHPDLGVVPTERVYVPEFCEVELEAWRGRTEFPFHLERRRH